MSKIKFNVLPLIVLGLITAAAPAHAGESLFDSWSKKMTDKVTDITHKVKDKVNEKIKEIYGDDSSTTPPINNYPDVTTPKAPELTPTLTPAASTRASLSQCQKFLGLMYNPSYENDPKKVASIYLNAALDFTQSDFDHVPSSAELAERNKCVELALDAGADPDSNGETRSADDHMSFGAPVPLVRAVRDNDEGAVKILLDHKANPNAEDDTMGNPVPLMNNAIYNSQEIAVDLINAGVDLSTDHLLWIAAGNAADKVVDLLIQSKKIPVNQLNKFTESTTDEEAETALDASESRLFALTTYQKKFASNSKLSVQDKVSEVNRVLYYNYPLKAQIKMSEDGSNSIDPDAFMNDLMTRQQKVSNSLKAAGWKCNIENCNIIDFGSNESEE